MRNIGISVIGMTQPLPKPTPMQKANKVAKIVRSNGKIPLARAAAMCGYSMSYFRWNMVPVVVSFFEDIKCDGTSIWCEKAEGITT